MKPNLIPASLNTLLITGVMVSVFIPQLVTAATVTVREDGQEVASGCNLNSMSGSPTNVIIDMGSGCLPSGGGSSGVTVYPTSLDLNEGQSQSVSISLHNAPTSNVTVNLNSSDTSEMTVGTSSVSFSTTDYFQPRTVLFTAVQDGVTDGDNNVTVTTSVSSTDPAYNGVSAPNVSAIVRNSTANPGVDTGDINQAWAVNNTLVTFTSSYAPYTSKRSFYPDCQNNLENYSTTTCNSSALNRNNWPAGTTYTERLVIGSGVPTDQTITVLLAQAEVGEATIGWDVTVSSRPGAFTPPSNPSQAPSANNAVNCVKTNAVNPIIPLLRSDHNTSPILNAEASSCVVEVGKVYYLDIRPNAANTACGTTLKCAVQVNNFLSLDVNAADFSSIFPYTLPQ